MAATDKGYTQGQLLLPLLQALEESGDAGLSAQEAGTAVAERLGLPDEVRARRIRIGRCNYNAFDRDVRWARQRAVLGGLVATPGPNHWTISGKGRRALREARPGVVVTVFETELGVALFGACQDVEGYIEDRSVQLLFTSPPYALEREKHYGNLKGGDYVDWMVERAAAWRRLLSPDGSLVLNLGDAWEAGRPVMSLYAERLLLRLVDDLGYRLCGRYEWHSTSKLPSPAEWVCVRRVRVKPTLERLYHLALTDHPYADNKQVLVPYSRSMQRRIAAGGERRAQRPSGHLVANGAFSRDCGGAIPSNLIVAPNSESNSVYMRGCKAAGLPVHPARFPAALPNFFIRLLTRPRQTVYDPCAGSLKTAEQAELLNRHWIACDNKLEYPLGGRFRFAQAA